MSREELNYYKKPYLDNLRKDVIEITNAPLFIKKGKIVEEADISHATFISFMKSLKNTKFEVVKRIERVINKYKGV
jgi:hypothetical protein